MNIVNGDSIINGNSPPVLADSGVSEHCFDDLLAPGLWGKLSDYTVVEVPRTITTGGNDLKGVAIGILSGRVIDSQRLKQAFGPRIVIVPDLGRNLYSVPVAPVQGVTTTFAQQDSRIETGSVVTPLQRASWGDSRRMLFQHRCGRPRRGHRAGRREDQGRRY